MQSVPDEEDDNDEIPDVLADMTITGDDPNLSDEEVEHLTPEQEELRRRACEKLGEAAEE